MTAPDSDQLLLILDPSVPAVRGRIEEEYRVLSAFSPRVLTIAGNVPPSVPGVLCATAAAVEPGLLAGLTESERLGIAAWQMRKAPKARLGDGLSWDAPGFLPPGGPRD